jgi:hypothetical protein
LPLHGDIITIDAISLMLVDLLQAIVFMIIVAAGYLAWKKYGNKDYLWFAVISLLGLLLMGWDYFSSNVLQLQLEIKLINSAISLFIWVSLIFMVLKVAIWGSKKK